MNGQYDDIIDLPHHISSRHPHMPVPGRAAQFAPFAALTGYDAAIRETARQTEQKVELDENAKAILDRKQQVLLRSAAVHPQITITHFKPDPQKSGGSYVSSAGAFRAIDSVRRLLFLTDGTVISLDNILDLDSELFREIF